MIKFVSTLALISCLANAASAETSVASTEGETKIKVEEFQDKNAVAGDIDTEITNAKLRAESGSKSKFSLSATANYSGGSINRAFAAKRPALRMDPGTQTRSSASLNPEVRYRWTKNDSVTLGTGFAAMTPLQGDVTKDAKGNHVKQFNVFDPYLNYNRAGRVGVFQTNGSLGLSAGTSTESQMLNNTVSPAVSYTMLHVFANGLTLGSAAQLTYSFYTSAPGSNPNTVADSYGHDERNSASLGLFPFVEYAFNDRFSLRTLFGYFNWVHRYGDPNNYRLLQDFVYQSVGVGISITRDIYLYPNIQFSPNASNQLSHDRTNVALAATINVF